MAVAVVAMAFALVGTAVAANDGTIYPKLTKSKVKKIAKKQANKQIEAKAPGLSVANADTVDGNRVVQIDFRPAGAANEVILDLNGLRMRADCNGTNDTITAETTVANSEIYFNTVRAGLSETSGDDDDFNPGDSLNLHPGQTSRELVGQVRYVSGAGDSVVVQWGSGSDIPGATCLTFGYAIGNGG
ncbi:MAG TPA: hypothetical protein VFS73_02855 [Solirubrobacterales bacterium]|jgi:hypothetical protein|nr:hypothetical protein [Solirubrobacterales bacterium]